MAGELVAGAGARAAGADWVQARGGLGRDEGVGGWYTVELAKLFGEEREGVEVEREGVW
jgi:hypothetical protein